MCTIVKEIVVQRETGLHIRPANELVQAIEKLDCTVFLEHGKERANAKSIMGLLTLTALRGAKLKLVATGPDAEEAVRCVEAVLTDGRTPD